jgi:arylsulfatase
MMIARLWVIELPASPEPSGVGVSLGSRTIRVYRARNDLELYDTHADPNELVNLAHDPKHRKEVMRLNAMVNALAEREIGKGLDDGREYPGPTAMYNQPG